MNTGSNMGRIIDFMRRQSSGSTITNRDVSKQLKLNRGTVGSVMACLVNTGFVKGNGTQQDRTFSPAAPIWRHSVETTMRRVLAYQADRSKRYNLPDRKLTTMSLAMNRVLNYFNRVESWKTGAHLALKTRVNRIVLNDMLKRLVTIGLLVQRPGEDSYRRSTQWDQLLPQVDTLLMRASGLPIRIKTVDAVREMVAVDTPRAAKSMAPTLADMIGALESELAVHRLKATKWDELVAFVKKLDAGG